MTTKRIEEICIRAVRIALLLSFLAAFAMTFVVGGELGDLSLPARVFLTLLATGWFAGSLWAAQPLFQESKDEREGEGAQ